MTLNTLRSPKPFVLPVALCAVALFGLAATSNAEPDDQITAHQISQQASNAPLHCEIEVSKTRYGHTYEGVVYADRTLNGSYQMHIRKSGSGGQSVINQSGNFAVSAGESATLGQATFGGQPATVDVELILHWNGTSLSCGTNSDA